MPPREGSRSAQIGAKIPKVLDARLRAACERLDISINQFLIDAIVDRLEKVEKVEKEGSA
jgi:hypothetical protein